MVEKAQTGHWYLVVECKTCHRNIAIGTAPPPDEVPEYHFAAQGPLSVQCDCGTLVQFQPSDIQRVQALQRH